MTLASQPTTSDLSQRRAQIRQWMEQCRASTLQLFAGVDHATFCQQAHPDFSPIGWHLGHIAYTEALWILQHSAQQPPLFRDYHRLFAADGLPKAERANLPSFDRICEYLQAVRDRVFQYLTQAPLDTEERLWRWLLQHESQHAETITLVLELLKVQGQLSTVTPVITPALEAPDYGLVEIPAGEFVMGLESLDTLDNERPTHRVYLETYWIDRYPVTCGQYRQFMAAGGYCDRQWWSEAGWQWLQTYPVTQPLYWRNDPLFEHHPVCGVSWYEAEAYANFRGKRLPTETEWEKAASWDATTQTSRLYPWGNAFPSVQHCNHHHHIAQTTPVNAYPNGQSASGCYDLLGNVWEWTNSRFAGYDGFEYYPYRGYSQVYFDGEHRVLRGSSWATRPWSMRASFRNWYHPGVRQILAGFRCVQDQP